MGMKNARKCNNDVRAYTPRSSTTGPRGTRGNRAQRQYEFRPVAPAWLGNESAQKFDAKTALFCLIFQSRKPDKGEVGGSSPPRPTIQPVNTRLFSLFPISRISVKKPFCQPFVNFTFSRMPLRTSPSGAFVAGFAL